MKEIDNDFLTQTPKVRPLEDFGIDKFAEKVGKSKFSRLFAGLALTSAIAAQTAACNSNPPAAEVAPLPSGMATKSPYELAPTTSGATEIPTLAAKPTVEPTLKPTEVKNPFEGLNTCRTWQEAANCPITEDDFRRISDYVKANYKFLPEAMKVSYVSFIPMRDRTSFMVIHALSEKENSTASNPNYTETNGKNKIFIYETLLSPIGEPLFFNLKKNPPEINYDNLIAVFPVNNADGSVGTYTIIVPPAVVNNETMSAEKRTKINLTRKFEKMAYLPPVYNMGWMPISYFISEDTHGNLVKEILQDTNNPDGKRMKLFKEWEKTAIVPEELEKLPLFGSDMTLMGGFHNPLN